MIFVTVGLHHTGFNRLIEVSDTLAGMIDERILIQKGMSSYQPKFAESFPFADFETIKRYMAQSRVIFAHAGAGTILSAMQVGRPLISYPAGRRRQGK